MSLPSPDPAVTAAATTEAVVAAHLDAVLASADDAILTVDLLGTITRWNGAAERLYGYRGEEAVGRSVTMLIEDPAEAQAVLEMVATGRTVAPYEARRRRRDGTVVDVAVSVSPVIGPNGRNLGAAAIARDISERRAAECQLAASERRYRTLVSQLPDSAVYEYDAELRLVRAEGPLIEGLGLPAERLVGRQLLEFLPPERAQAFAAECRAALRGEARRFEWEGVFGDSILDVDVVPRWADDAIDGVIVLTRDVSAPRRTERDLHVHAQLIDRLEAVIVVTDLDGRITHWNRHAESVYTRPAAEVVGRSLAAVYRDYGLPDPGPVLAALRDGTTLRHERTAKLPDGRTLPMLVTSSALRDAAGAVVGFAGIGVDLTPMHEAQAEKEELQLRIQQDHTLDSIGRLAGGIAHDFNNLLAVIGAYADLVADGLRADDDLRADVVQIQKAVERASALTNQLLVFGRQDVAQVVAVDVRAVVGEIESLLARTIGEHIELRTEIAAELSPVCADPAQVSRVLLNLAVNARDAMPEGGALTIRAVDAELEPDQARRVGAAPGTYVVVTVADTGCGIPDDVAGRIFEPFFTTKPRGEGTGLGLATAYAITGNAGGFIDFSTAAGEGTTFRVGLPRWDAEVCGEAPAKNGGELHGGRGETILLVEDHPAVRRMTARLLQEGGYRVIDASGGEEALARATEEPVDLLLTDVVMPGMGGMELARRVRAADEAVRVLFMSGHTDDVVMRHGIRERRVAFVQKPFKATTLLGRVRAILDGGAEQLDGAS